MEKIKKNNESLDKKESSALKIKNLDRFVGGQLRRERKRRNMTLHETADAMGISYQQIQKYEHGISRVSAATLYRLTEIYKIDIGNFFKEIIFEASLFRQKGMNIPEGGVAAIGINLILAEANPVDELITRNALKEIENLNLLCLHDGMQILDVLKYKTLCTDFPKPHLILLDINTPKRDGISVLKELKQDDKTRDIPVVIITNNANPELTNKAYKHGAVGYILKSPIFSTFKENILNCVQYLTKTVIVPARKNKSNQEQIN